MLEVPGHRPIEPLLREILECVCQATQALDVQFFVGGAMARDILLTHVFGQRMARATRDVDLGLYLGSWGQFQALKDRLVAAGRFVAEPGSAQRLRYPGPRGMPVDFIPFGAVSTPDKSISWPPDHDIVLNVAGFEDAFASSLVVDLGGGLRVRTCSLPGLAVLKLMAWKDRGLATNKDAIDFLLLAQRYGQAQNLDRLYTTEQGLLIEAGYDPDLAGAMLLGKDAAMQCQPDTAHRIAGIWAEPALRQRMLDQLLRAQAGVANRGDAAGVEDFVDAFGRGFAAAQRLG